MLTRWIARSLLAVVTGLCLSSAADARVRLEHLCMVQGQQEIKLTGLGLVVGLPGTGDGAKNLATVRALRAALTKMNQPVNELDLKNADNVAVVMIEATIPKSGLRRGQKIDCYVSAIMGAKSLRGGRLLTAPLTTAEVNRDLVLGIASGALQPEDPQRPTMAKITTGVDLTEDVTTLFVNTTDQSITLLIDSAHASFWTANEIARVINSDLTFETSGEQLAKSVSPGAVQVKIPRHYRDNPVGFVAEVLDVGIDTPHTAARVILNARTGTVIVTGEVEISPVVITHKSFTVEVGDQQPAGPSSSGPFRSIQDQNTRQSPQQLKDLLDALNQLRVPTADIIAILRELHTTGKLHAELIER